MSFKDKKVVILGASRGLGFELAQLALQKGLQEKDLLLVSRKIMDSPLKNAMKFNSDLSKSEESEGLILKIKEFSPDYIWYCAGGGPHGLFANKEWKDHHWALQVSFYTTAKIIYNFLKGDFTKCQQFVAVGSNIAENKPDKMAASYCAAKHALRGLVTTLQLEYPEHDLRLFSPNYMDTSLLPKNAFPRQQNKTDDPKLVAECFLNWALDFSGLKLMTYP